MSGAGAYSMLSKICRNNPAKRMGTGALVPLVPVSQAAAICLLQTGRSMAPSPLPRHSWPKSLPIWSIHQRRTRPQSGPQNTHDPKVSDGNLRNRRTGLDPMFGPWAPSPNGPPSSGAPGTPPGLHGPFALSGLDHLQQCAARASRVSLISHFSA